MVLYRAGRKAKFIFRLLSGTFIDIQSIHQHPQHLKHDNASVLLWEQFSLLKKQALA